MQNKIITTLMTLCVISTSTYASLSGKKIGLDPGHGGVDPGAHSPSLGSERLYERDVALAIGLSAKKYFIQDGASVTMTREDQGLKSLYKKVQKLNSAGVHKAVSIHLNAASPTVNRTMDFVYCGKCSTHASLAGKLVDELVTSTGLSKGASIAAKLVCNQSQYGVTKCPQDGGVGQGNIYVLRATNMPAVLLEVSFISNLAEETKLKNSDYIDKQGYAIYAGIAKEYGENPLPRDGTSSNTCNVETIPLNQNISGTYTSSCESEKRVGSYAKLYKFTLTQQQKVAIKLDATTTADAFLYLMHENGNMIISDDDSAGNRDSEIIRILPAGTYMLEATTYGAGQTGDFTISVVPEVIADPCSPKNLSLNQTLSGDYTATCMSNSRYDRYAKYFKFTLTQQQQVTIDLDADYLSDAFLYLLHNNGNMIISDDDGGGLRDSRITRTLPAGTYILEATTYHKQKTGNFEISVK